VPDTLNQHRPLSHVSTAPDLPTLDPSRLVTLPGEYLKGLLAQQGTQAARWHARLVGARRRTRSRELSEIPPYQFLAEGGRLPNGRLSAERSQSVFLASLLYAAIGLVEELAGGRNRKSRRCDFRRYVAFTWLTRRQADGAERTELLGWIAQLEFVIATRCRRPDLCLWLDIPPHRPAIDRPQIAFATIPTIPPICRIGLHSSSSGHVRFLICILARTQPLEACFVRAGRAIANGREIEA